MTGKAAVRALVLRTFDYGETSQILHALTREQGRVHGIAKGARRLNGEFKGGVDALHLGEATVYARRAGADLRTFGSFETKTCFPGLHAAIARFHAASHVLAVVLALTREEEPDAVVFDLAVSALLLVEEAGDDAARAVALGFEAMMLNRAGFFPELTRCVACGRPARNVTTARLSASRGGLLCRDCGHEDAAAPQVTGAVVTALVGLGSGPLADAPALAADADVRRALVATLDRWTTHTLDRPLRTSQFLV